MNILTADKIVKKFGNFTALSDLSLNVEEAQIFGLLGPNGAGKTTFIRIINQITAPDSGEVFLFGEKLNSKHIQDIGYLPEERGLYKKMTVGEQAVYFARLKGMKKDEAKNELVKWFRKFEIMSWWHKKVEELSKGMQQKVQFVTTVIHRPKLLIFDEPFSGFDPINAELLKNEILELKKQGATIIFSTHNMESVEQICDSIVLINKSEKILEGNVQSVRQQFKTNTYEISFNGHFDKMTASLSADYEIVSIVDFKGNYKAKIKLLNGITTNELLLRMTKFGNIAAFNEIIPSMNEVFIKAVSKTE